MKVSAVVGLISMAYAQDYPTIPVGTFMGCGLLDVPVNYPKSCPATDCCGTANVNNNPSKVCGPRYTWTVSSNNGETTVIPSAVGSLSITAKLAQLLEQQTVSALTGAQTFSSFTCDTWEKSAKHLALSASSILSAIYFSQA